MPKNLIKSAIFILSTTLPITPSHASLQGYGTLSSLDKSLTKDLKLFENFFVGDDLQVADLDEKNGVNLFSAIEEQEWFGDHDSKERFWRIARNKKLSARKKSQFFEIVIFFKSFKTSLSIWAI